jgi:hypothetical protein
MSATPRTGPLGSFSRLLALLLPLLGCPGLRAADAFGQKILPFLNTYCVRCHNQKTARGQLDLTRFSSAEKILADFRQWEHVVAFVKKEEMPPAQAKQPAAAQRAEVVAALEGVLRAQARRLAGEPGVVPPRRLSNAEYDYTIRDLTGVDIRPAKAFPVDPAAGEGFNNTGEALTMSPGLFKKYYAAAEHVADHALLTPSGLRFAPHPVVAFADRQKYYEQAVLRFYERHAVDYETYFTALWLYRHRPAVRKAAGLDGWAAENGLSPKYLRSLWQALQGGGAADGLLTHWLRKRWDALPPPADPDKPVVSTRLRSAVRALAADLRRMSGALCVPETQAIVANGGNGPIEHLDRRRRTAASRDAFDPKVLADHRLRYEFRQPAGGAAVKLVVRVAGLPGVRPDGCVVLRGEFTTNGRTSDGKKKWSLRDVLARHAPDQLAKLKFGVHPLGDRVDADSLVLQAPGTLEIEVPAGAFPLRGRGNVAFTADCRLDRSSQGIALVRLAGRTPAGGQRPAGERILLDPKHPAARQFELSAAAFCRLFPNRFYYADPTRGLSAGFHLIEGFFRDDRPLCKYVLTDGERRELDRLWDELNFGTGIWEKLLRGFVFFERSERNFLKHPDFDSFKEEDPGLVTDAVLSRFEAVYLRRSGVKAMGAALAGHPIHIFFEEVRAGLRGRAATFERASAAYLADLHAFAEAAYRRPLTAAERQKLEAFYHRVRQDKAHGVEAAVRASVVRVLASPHFCYHLAVAPPGETVAPLPDLALASRLSYFLWSSVPDAELLKLARAGKLRDERVLLGQVRRMLKDPKVSRFALEFFGQWLGHRDFLTREAVDRQVFPAFNDALKQTMFEEPTRLTTWMIQEDRPVTRLLDGDVTLVNGVLARHYGIPFAGRPDDWKLARGLHERGRGGVLGMAVFLTKNSQPQRTSPVKRGFWVVDKLLGEHIPPPPPDVAVLPAKETDTRGKTIRQLLALHTSDARCARCHQRFDPVGLAMEGFDPIGRGRAKDLAGRPIDNLVRLPGGAEARGVPAFGRYLAARRKQDFTRTLCHKFLGYALGRSLQLSDGPLLEKMRADLPAHGYRLRALFELVAASPQFRNQRCRNFTPSRFKPDTQGANE